MSLFSDRFKELRASRSYTQEKLAELLGVSKSRVNMYERGEREPNFEMLESIADFFNVDMNYLIGKAFPGSLEFDNEIPPGFMPLPKMKRVPLIGTIACGTPILAEENIEGYIETFDDMKCDFCLRCKGDSMINARIHDGDVVFIRKQPYVENGQIAAVLIDDEATLKRVYKHDDHIVLSAENPMFPPVILLGNDAEALRIQGVAVAFLSKVE